MATQITFPLSNPSGLEPPHEYARLRVEEPVAKVTLPTGDQAWIVTRYDYVRTVFSDPRFSRAAASRPGAPSLMPGVEADPESIISKDPPDHTRLRKLVAQAFTPRRIEAMRSRIQEVSDRLLDAMAAAGPPADLVSGLASPLPITVICDLIGIPEADRHRFRQWSSAMFSTAPGAIDEALGARNDILSYLGRLIAHRRSAPTDDLLGVLITARDEQDRLSEAELRSFAGGLLVAGYENTANRIANGVLSLLRQPDQLALLREEPARIQAAVEELLRFAPGGAAGSLMRVATEDVELGGVTIRAGDGVIAITIAANRDGAVYRNPDRFDVRRASGPPHATFGYGVHACIGSQLARLEMQVGIGSLVQRFPRLRLAVKEEDLAWRNAVVQLSLMELPVTW